MTTGFSCQWECKGSFSRVSDLIWLTKEPIFTPAQKVTDWTEARAAQCFHFCLSEEGIHFWRSSWGRRSPMTDQRRSFSARGERRISEPLSCLREESRNMWSPYTLNICPTWHLTSPHVPPSQYLSSIKGIINVFNINHRRVSPAQTQARTQTREFSV